MNFIKEQMNKAQGGNSTTTGAAPTSSSGGGGGGGIMGKINNSMGGGQKGEQNEDALDKGVDYVQEHIFHQGPQNNESAVEQAKDEQISDAIRRGYKSTTGKEFPMKDKS